MTEKSKVSYYVGVRMAVMSGSRKDGRMRFASRVLALALLATVVVAAPAAAERTVTISGGGWGHGIGMSQYGTLGRAQNGAGHKEILEHYYTGTKVTTVSIPSRIRVGLLQGRSSISVTTEAHRDGGGRAVFRVEGQRGVLSEGGVGTTWRVEASSTGGMRLFKNGSKVKRDGKTVFGDPSHRLKLAYVSNGTRIDPADKTNDYAHGRMDFGTYESSSCGGYCTRLVVQLSMQNYLYGLGEVPASWPHAALRTQAVAARTYAYDKLLRYPNQDRYPCDCAVFDSTYDQVYSGDGKRLGSGQWWDDWQAAVDDTKDEVVLYGGQPINALYSSSSGGHTENNENVWGGTPLPYLRGVPDKPDSVSSNPNHTWEKTMSYSAFAQELNEEFGVGKLEEFKIVGPRGVSGRVTVVNESTNEGGVRIKGSNKTVRVDGWTFHVELGLLDTLFEVDLGTEVGENMKRKYGALEGAPGDPLDVPYSVPNGWKKPLGWAQDFEVGRMTWIRSLDRAVWQRGPVLQAYDGLGGKNSRLGMPTSDLWGKKAYRGASYTGGDIIWSKKTKARVLRGDFRAAFRKHGGVTGPLGLPVGDQQKGDSLPNGGRRQRFQGGTLYLNPKADAVFALWGRVGERYRKLGEATSDCGYPTAALLTAGSTATGTFEHGTIVWSEASGMAVRCG